MAREWTVKMTDDLDRRLTATQTREVGYSGTIYILDLSTKHAEELDKLLEPYLEAAHEKLKWPKSQLKAVLKGSVTPNLADNGMVPESKHIRQRMRQWGRENGFPKVSDRGLLPKALVQAYTEAHA